MRAILILSLVTSALASPVHAQWAGDRYGYGPAPRSNPASALPATTGRVLNWSNKSVAVAEPAADDRGGPRYETRAQYEPQRPIDRPPERLAALSPSPNSSLPPMARQPSRSYSPPPVPLELAGGPSAQSQYTPPEPPVRQVAAAGASGQARYYSLHREYGLAPDAIPEQPTGARYVLIGPSPSDGLGRDNSGDHDAREGASDRPF